MIYLRFSAGSCLACLVTFWAVSSVAEEYKPWTLRDRYTFSGESTKFSYDVNTAEWMLEVDGVGAVIQDAQAEIEFADGRTIRLSDMELEDDERENFSGPFGAGTYFRSVLKSSEGLQVRFALARLKECPFLMLQLGIINNTSEPIDIAALNTVVFPKGSILGDDRVTIKGMSTTRWAGYPTMNEDDVAIFVRFDTKGVRAPVGIGVLETGRVDSGIVIEKKSGDYAGLVRSRFTPSVRVEPGGALQSDPVWVTFSVPEAEKVDQYYAWSQTQYPTKLERVPVPRMWVTVNEGATAEELYSAASEEDAAGIEYAVVPAGWEVRPGALEGDAPRFPSDMRDVSRGLLRLGKQPGITIDPLAVDELDKDWAEVCENGYAWLNTNHEGAKDFHKDRFRRMAKWGYAFFVVQPSAVPDDVLSHYNMTRTEANLMAFRLAYEAADGLPVLPAPGFTLDGDVDRWREAGQAMLWYRQYGADPAPIRFRMDSLKGFSPELAEAVLAYGGPVELVAPAKKKVWREFTKTMAVPVDAGLDVARSD